MQIKSVIDKYNYNVLACISVGMIHLGRALDHHTSQK